jgi:hypothetical protein
MATNPKLNSLSMATGSTSIQLIAGRLRANTKGIGRKIKRIRRASLFMRMVVYTMEAGKMISGMTLEK